MALKRITGLREETYTGSETETRSYKRYHFKLGISKDAPGTRPWISQTHYRKLRKVQLSEPVSVGTISVGEKTLGTVPLRGKTLWWFNDGFYIQDQDDQHPPGHQRENGTTGLVKVAGVTERTTRESFLSFQKRYDFAIGTSENPPATEPWISSTAYDHLRARQSQSPVSVGTISTGKHKGSTLWWFKDQFYVGEDHPPGRKRKNGTTGLRQVPSASPVEQAFDKEVTLPSYKMRFKLPGFGAPSTDRWLSKKDHLEAKALQKSKPVSVGTMLGGRYHLSTFWWYQDEFYAENDGYTAEEVQLLLWEREQRRDRKLQRLKKEMLSDRALEDARRERIPDDVRIFVWKRDEGRCVQCGSQDKLEFDHIIPISKGGSNTARNIQLLCETCNRGKSDST
jgi:hypothetical protein